MTDGVRAGGALAAALLLAAAAGAGGGRVYPSAEAAEPLPVGAPVPEVSFTSVGGERVALADLVREHGATLVFYRGGW